MDPETPQANADHSPPRFILLATLDDGRFGEVACRRVRQDGWEPLVVASPEDIVEALRAGRVAAVLLDVAFPRASDVLEELKVDPRTNGVPVVALFPRGAAPMRPTSVRVQADLELGEPCDVAKLLGAVTRQAAAAREASADARVVRFLVPSRRDGLERAGELFASLLGHTSLGEEEQTSFLAAFREAVANAIQHGNGADPARVVCVCCRTEPARLTVEVRDQGEGFDAASYLELAEEMHPAEAARDRSRQGGRGGLGIMMMLRFTDELRYNGRGNAVTLVKHLKGACP